MEQTLALPQELFKAMQYIHDNFADISFVIKLKLNFIASNLVKHYATPEEKNELGNLILPLGKQLKPEEELIELSQLHDLPPEILIKIYVDTVSTLFPSSGLLLSSLIKKGALFVRSQTLRLWGERFMELNYGLRVFKILRSSPKKPDKVLDLNTYELKWFGQLGSRYCFGLNSTSTKNHYKSFCIGMERVELAREWYESIRVSKTSCYVSSFIEQRNKSNKAKKPAIKTQDDINVKPEGGKPHKTIKTFKQIKEEFDQRKNNGGKQAENGNNKGKLLAKKSGSFCENMVGERNKDDLNFNESLVDSPPQNNTNNNNNNRNRGFSSSVANNMHPLSLDFFQLEEIPERKSEFSPNFRMLENPRESIFSFESSMKLEGQTKNDNKDILKEKQTKIKAKKADTNRKMTVFYANKTEKRIILHKNIAKIKNFSYFRMRFQAKTHKTRRNQLLMHSSGNIFRDYGELFYRNPLINDPPNLIPVFFRNFELKSTLKININSLFEAKNANFLDLAGQKSTKYKKQRIKIALHIPFSFRLIIHYLIEPGHINQYNPAVLSARVINGFGNLTAKNSTETVFMSIKLRVQSKWGKEIIIERRFFEGNDYFVIMDSQLDFGDSTNDNFRIDDSPVYSNNSSNNYEEAMMKSFIIIKKTVKPNEPNLAIDGVIIRGDMDKDSGIVKTLNEYFNGFANIADLLRKAEVCFLMKNIHSYSEGKIREKVAERREIKILMERKHLIGGKTMSLQPRKQGKQEKKRNKSLSNNEKNMEPFKNQQEKKKKTMDFLSKLGRTGKLVSECIKSIVSNANSLLLSTITDFISAKASKPLLSRKKWQEKLKKQGFLRLQRELITRLKSTHYEQIISKGLDFSQLEHSNEFFSSETLMEKMARALALGVLFFGPKGKSDTPIERIGLFTAFMIVFLNRMISHKAPRGNRKGDTLHWKVNGENQIYLEDIGGKVLVLIIGNGFKISGNLTPSYRITTQGLILGFSSIKLALSFPNQNKPIKLLEIPILKTFDNPKGVRELHLEGRGLIFDENSELLSETFFNTRDTEGMAFSFCDQNGRGSAEFVGSIKSAEKSRMKDILSGTRNTRKFKEMKRLARIEGDIYGNVTLNHEVLCESTRCFPDLVIEPGDILPSYALFSRI